MKIDWKFFIIVFLITLSPAKGIDIGLPIRDILAGLAECGMLSYDNRGDIRKAYDISDSMLKYRNSKEAY